MFKVGDKLVLKKGYEERFCNGKLTSNKVGLHDEVRDAVKYGLTNHGYVEVEDTTIDGIFGAITGIHKREYWLEQRWFKKQSDTRGAKKKEVKEDKDLIKENEELKKQLKEKQNKTNNIIEKQIKTIHNMRLRDLDRQITIQELTVEKLEQEEEINRLKFLNRRITHWQNIEAIQDEITELEKEGK